MNVEIASEVSLMMAGVVFFLLHPLGMDRPATVAKVASRFAKL